MTKKEDTLFDSSQDLTKKIILLEKENKNLKDELRTLKSKNSFLEVEIKDLEKLKPDKTFGGIIVSGDVLLNKLEVEIVNTLHFQRLRKIKQLGSTNLVYPSAIHTRFEHSLGVLKIANTIIQQIKNNRHSSESEKRITAAEEQIIRLLALLHDIGHMPYGHTIEDEFGIFLSHDKHMTRWEYFLGEDSVIGKIIIKHWDLQFHKRFFQLIKCEKEFRGFEEDAYMYDIVSNTVCADLLDYLERDCLHTNLKLEYHRRFMDYFYIKSITKNSEDKSERRIAIRVYKKGHKKELRKDTLSELIQLLRNRYYLGERVYYHHAKIKFGTLLAGAVLRIKFVDGFFEEKIINKNMLKNISNNNDTDEDKILFNIHLQGDDELLQYIKSVSAAGKTIEQLEKINGAKKLAELFNSRIIYKQIEIRNKIELSIDKYDIDNISDGNLDLVKSEIAKNLYHNLIKRGSSFTRLEIEDRICEYLPEMSSGDLLIYCPNFNMAMKLAKVKITDARENVFELRNFDDDTIQEECESILNKHQDLWAIRIFINPKYVDEKHIDYKANYKKYNKIIKEYIEWKLFSRDHEEEIANGNHFWNSYITHMLSVFDGELTQQSTPKRVNEKTNELVQELLYGTGTTKKYDDIENMIRKKFSIKKA